MRGFKKKAAVTLMGIFPFILNSVHAENSDRMTELANETALLKAQQDRDNAEAEQIKAAINLATAKAAAASNNAVIQASSISADTSLKKAQIANSLAEVSAIKDAVGDPGKVGNSGTVTFEDGKTAPVFLPIQAGSLELVWAYAEKMCSQLNSIGPVYSVSADFDASAFSAGTKMLRFNALYSEYSKSPAKNAANAQAHSFVAGAVATEMAIKYTAEAVQTVARLFHSDRKITIGASKDRAEWLMFAMNSRCPTIAPGINIDTDFQKDAVITDFQKRLAELEVFVNSQASSKSSVGKEVETLKSTIDNLTKKKQPHTQQDTALKNAQSRLADLNSADDLVGRIKTVVSDIQSKMGEWYSTILLDQSYQFMKDKKRLYYELTTQDAQVSKENWLLGTRVYGTSAGELVYRVVDATGSVVAANYLLAQNATGKLDFSEKFSTRIRAAGEN